MLGFNDGGSATKNLRVRSEERKKRMRANRAASHEEAELWDLMYWQSCSPEERLSALVHIHRDIQKVKKPNHLTKSSDES